MKKIKYNLCTRINHGTEEEPLYEDLLSPVEIHCTADKLEANEAIAKAEAYNGEYTIEDDGQPEPEVQPTQEERIAELEGMMNALLGVSE